MFLEENGILGRLWETMEYPHGFSAGTDAENVEKTADLSVSRGQGGWMHVEMLFSLPTSLH